MTNFVQYPNTAGKSLSENHIAYSATPTCPKELFKKLWSALKSGKEFSGIIKNKKKDGSHYWVHATLVPVKNEEGKIYKYIGSRYHIENDSHAAELFEKQFARARQVVG